MGLTSFRQLEIRASGNGKIEAGAPGALDHADPKKIQALFIRELTVADYGRVTRDVGKADSSADRFIPPVSERRRFLGANRSCAVEHLLPFRQ